MLPPGAAAATQSPWRCCAVGTIATARSPAPPVPVQACCGHRRRRQRRGAARQGPRRSLATGAAPRRGLARRWREQRRSRARGTYRRDISIAVRPCLLSGLDARPGLHRPAVDDGCGRARVPSLSLVRARQQGPLTTYRRPLRAKGRNRTGLGERRQITRQHAPRAVRLADGVTCIHHLTEPALAWSLAAFRWRKVPLDDNRLASVASLVSRKPSRRYLQCVISIQPRRCARHLRNHHGVLACRITEPSGSARDLSREHVTRPFRVRFSAASPNGRLRRRARPPLAPGELLAKRVVRTSAG